MGFRSNVFKLNVFLALACFASQPALAIGDREGHPSSGVTKRLKSTTSDKNGDGKINTGDALFITILSGGTHKATIDVTSKTSTSMSKGGSSSSSTASTNTKSASGGVSFAGVGFSASKSVSKEAAEKVEKHFKEADGEIREISRNSDLEAFEYETKCSYLVGVYKTYLVETWEPVPESGKDSLGPGVTNVMSTAYKSEAAAETWKYFHFRNRKIHTQRLVGSALIGYREKDGVSEVYKKTGEYEVTRLEDFAPRACSAADVQGRAKKAMGGSNKNGQGAMKNKFKFEGKGDSKTGERDWGVYTKSRLIFREDQECGASSSGYEKFTYWRKKEKGQSQQNNESQTTTTSMSFGVKATKGKASADGKISDEEKKQDESTEKEFEESGKEKFMTVRVQWNILNAHAHHWSDHMIAPMDRKGDSTGAAGLLVLRYAERWCLGTPEPEEPKTPHTDPPRPVSTPTPSVTPPAPDRKSVDDPPTTSGGDTEPDIDVPTDEDTPSGEPTQEPGAPPDDRTQEELDAEKTSDTATMDSLKGQTNINADRVGEPSTVTARDSKGREIPIDGTNIRVGRSPGMISLHITGTREPSTIKVTGHRGIVILRSSFIPPRDYTLPTAPPRPVHPSDGRVDVVNKTVSEAVATPLGVTDMSAPPGAHSATLGGQPVNIVATRVDEIAISGSNIAPPQTGSTPITISSPNGDTTTATLPAWAYALGAAPSTTLNTWAPIYFQCTGLAPSTIIDITFEPTGAQIIEPTHVEVPCGTAEALTPIANYQTSQLGPQVFNAIVKVPQEGGND